MDVPKFYLPLLVLVICGTHLSGQTSMDHNYNRSSLHMILIESEDYLKKDIITKAYHNKPFPDKYNDHSVEENLLQIRDYPELWRKHREANVGNSQNVPHVGFKGVSTTEIFARHVENNEVIQEVITAYIEDTKLANQIIGKWFNRQENGSFNMQLIQERGEYNSTELEAGIAENSVRGRALLRDAGIELINNTFVVFSKLNFVENEPIARMVKNTTMQHASKIRNPLLSSQARKAASKAYDKLSKGYSVWTTSWLYKLNWNEEVEAHFFEKYWMNDSNIDPSKKKAFESTDLFELEFVGTDYSQSLVTFSLKENRSEEEIVEVATIRNVDATLAKLQKNHDVFKPKVPVLSTNPVTAKIGRKEGLEGGEKFEVLEIQMNPETGLTEYKQIDKVKVDKEKIWDNRYKASILINDEKSSKNNKDIDRTTFKRGNNKIQAGMLMRQIK